MSERKTMHQTITLDF